MGPRHFSILQRVFYTASGVGCGFLLESRDLVELESALSPGLHYGYQRITVTPSSLVTSFLGLQPQVPCWRFLLSGPIRVLSDPIRVPFRPHQSTSFLRLAWPLPSC